MEYTDIIQQKAICQRIAHLRQQKETEVGRQQHVAEAIDNHLANLTEQAEKIGASKILLAISCLSISKPNKRQEALEQLDPERSLAKHQLALLQLLYSVE